MNFRGISKSVLTTGSLYVKAMILISPPFLSVIVMIEESLHTIVTVANLTTEVAVVPQCLQENGILVTGYVTIIFMACVGKRHEDQPLGPH